MNFNLYLTNEDEPYLGFLRALLPGHSLTLFPSAPTTVTEALLSGNPLLICNPAFIKQIVQKNKCNHEDYFGSFWIKKNLRGAEVQLLVLPPLKRLVTTKPGSFLFRRYLKKILSPTEWFQASPFSWSLADDTLGYATAFDYLSGCDMVAVDIETSPAYKDQANELDPQHVISCSGYCGVRFRGGTFSAHSFVLPIKSLEALRWVRRINLLPSPKVFQNGKYDNFYFLRFGAPIQNWLFDTMELHHSIYSELPKSLGYLAPFYLREVSFWKDEGKTGDLQDFYRYNAKDCWATANSFLSAIQEAPEWAIKNYLLKFGLVFPCLACELDGLRSNPSELARVRKEQDLKQTQSLASIRKKIGKPFFNPASPKQVLSLLHVLGNRAFKSSDEKHLIEAADKHPIAKRIIDDILACRESSTLISKYLYAELWKGKLLYTLNPSGTDTMRLASKESQLWCGAQVQNLPSYFKQTLEAEEGFNLGEADFEQAESRCTAYLSGDENLIAAVESPRDFHATNASNFFGLSFEQIMEEEKAAKKQAVKPFTTRDLSKRVNHGANYNMGAKVLLATMGMKNVLRAQALLKLPSAMSPVKVCEFLLEKFHAAYPKIKAGYPEVKGKGSLYESIATNIKLSKMLTSELGWTRLCFGKPWASKPDLNGYVAHVPSNLNAGILNEAFADIFWNIQMKSAGAFRLKAQIHDSILFAYKEDRIDLVQDAAARMLRPKLIKDCSGKTRLMTIPVAMKCGAKNWAKLRPLEDVLSASIAA